MSIVRARSRTARVAILAIVEEEWDAVAAAFGPLKELPGTPYWSPDLEAVDVVLRRSADRGNTPATHATRSLIEDFRPEVVILLGVAGGIVGGERDAVRRGDVVVPTFLHYAEFVKVAQGGRLKRYVTFDHPTVSLRENHVEAARVARSWASGIQTEPPEETTAPELVLGTLVAGEKILSDPDSEEQRAIVAGYPEAVGIDMESFGAARAVHDARTSVGYNPRFLVIRGVSDYVYADPGDVPDQYDNVEERKLWKPYAAATAAALAREITDRILRLDDDRSTLRAEEHETEAP